MSYPARLLDRLEDVLAGLLLPAGHFFPWRDVARLGIRHVHVDLRRPAGSGELTFLDARQPRCGTVYRGEEATSSADGTVRIWNAATGQERASLTGHTGTVTAVAAAPDGSWLASGSADSTVRSWRMTRRHPARATADLSESVRAAAVHGNVIITAAGA